MNKDKNCARFANCKECIVEGVVNNVDVNLVGLTEYMLITIRRPDVALIHVSIRLECLNKPSPIQSTYFIAFCIYQKLYVEGIVN